MLFRQLCSLSRGSREMTVNFSSGAPTVGPLFIRTSIVLCIVAAALVAFRCWQIYDRRGWFGIEEGMVLASMVNSQCLGAVTSLICDR